MEALDEKLTLEEKKIDEIAAKVEHLEKLLDDATQHDVVKDILVPAEKEGNCEQEVVQTNTEDAEGEGDNDLPKLTEVDLLKIENNKLRYRIKFLTQAYDQLIVCAKSH